MRRTRPTISTQARTSRPRAAFVAGRAAHIASREAEARGYFERAQSLASDETLGWRATLGAVVAAIELEDPLVEDLLNSLGPARPIDPAAEVAIADRYLAYETRFCRPVDLHRGRAASQLLRFVRDPCGPNVVQEHLRIRACVHCALGRGNSAYGRATERCRALPA